jgi:hypothetical protein
MALVRVGRRAVHWPLAPRKAVMSYGVVFDIAATDEFYEASHAEFRKCATDAMLLHVARRTDTGYQVVEVWRSKEEHDRWTAEHVGRVLGALAAAGWTLPEPVVTEFEPRGLIVTGAGISV